MPKGPATNKTEFMRYLDDHPDCCPLLAATLAGYQSIKHREGKFGFWMRTHRTPEFAAAYNQWWLHRPRLFDQVYTPDLSRNSGPIRQRLPL